MELTNYPCGDDGLKYPLVSLNIIRAVYDSMTVWQYDNNAYYMDGMHYTQQNDAMRWQRSGSCKFLTDDATLTLPRAL